MTQLALVIDLNVCVGCHACVTSCKQWNTSGAAGPLVDQHAYAAEPAVFHSLQLVTQAWQPTQTFKSMTRASWVMTPGRCARARRTNRPAP